MHYWLALPQRRLLGNLYVKPINLCNRHFPNLFCGHKKHFFSIGFIPRLDLKLLFRVHSSKFGKCLYAWNSSNLPLTIFLYVFLFSNNWECHNPYSNLLWIRYLIDKMLNAKKYKKPNSSIQRNIRTYLRQVLSYESAFQAVQDGFPGLVFNDGL